LLETFLASFEGGQDCAAFSSGMAASAAVLETLRPGDHVVIPDDVYHGTRTLVDDLRRTKGIEVSIADMTPSGDLANHIRRNTRLIWTETPSNPRLRLTDLQRVADRARECGAVLVVDGTWTTPLLQRPLDLGADLVVHSVTKYMAGHSDVLGGAVVAGSTFDFTEVRRIQETRGAVLDPFDCYLALRGLRSLGVRMERQCQSASRLAELLDGHPRVERVHYPGLPTHPHHGVAVRQMTAFGAMVSFELKGSRGDTLAAAAAATVFRQATSLGGTESLIEHRASAEGPGSTAPENLIRLSVGLEHVDDLWMDLEACLRY
jgi:cystathionine gamma-synthase